MLHAHEIMTCERCNLCKNQKPLLDTKKECQIVWVGLSAKKKTSSEEIPLSPSTKSGALIEEIESVLTWQKTYKTNLVKCLPLDDAKKLRYPNKSEITECIGNLNLEIESLSPKIVFLLGEKVYSSVGRFMGITFNKWKEFNYEYQYVNGTYFIPIHHPSYISVYKRKEIDTYTSSIQSLIRKLL